MDALEQLGVEVKKERPTVVAAVVAAGSILESASRIVTGADGRETVEFEPYVLDGAAAQVTESAQCLFSALRSEEAAILRGRRDPWDEAAKSLEEFVWLCWALAEFPCTIEPRSPARALIAEFHVDACRIALEVVCLLREGFYGGARARWRSIHELAVFGEVISLFGDPAAESFRAHEAQQKKKLAGVLKKYGPAWGMNQLASEVSADLDRAFAEARRNYGEEFDDSDYGWAAHFVSPKVQSWAVGETASRRKASKRRVTFADLEDSVGATRWRVHYALASSLVHGRLPSGPVVAGNDSLTLRLALVDPGDGHVGALTALLISSLTQVLMELSADQSDKADKLRAWFAFVAVEHIRQGLDKKFAEAEDELTSVRVGE